MNSNNHVSDAARQQEFEKRFGAIFLRDANRSVAVLDAFIEKTPPYSEEDMRAYVIHTHGMKSALANMRKPEISDIASKLELFAREKDIEAIARETPVFLDALKAYVAQLQPEEKTVGEEAESHDKQYFTDMLIKINLACDEYDESIVEEVLAELKKIDLPQKEKELLLRIDEQLLHSAFDEIAADINSYMD